VAGDGAGFALAIEAALVCALGDGVDSSRPLRRVAAVCDRTLDWLAASACPSLPQHEISAMRAGGFADAADRMVGERETVGYPSRSDSVEPASWTSSGSF